MNNGDTAIQIVVEFDRSLLQYCDVGQWNAYVASLKSQYLAPCIMTPGEPPPAISVVFDFSRLQRAHYNMDGIDLSICWIELADFTGASLRNARLGCGRNVSYRGARLHGADFSGGVEISGCDFTGALGLEEANFDGAAYDPANPPTGLPPSILDICLAEAEPPPSNPRSSTNPMEPSGFQQAPLRCHASIHVIPVIPKETNHGEE